MNVAIAAHAATMPSATRLVDLYRHVWRHAKGARARYVAALVLLASSQAVKLLIPWLAAQAIDTVQTAGSGQLGRAGMLTAAIFLVYIAAWAMHGPGRILERNTALRVRASVADALYAKLARLPLAWHESQHSGDVQRRAQQASDALARFTETQFVYLQNVINVLGPLVALWLLAPLTGGIALVGYVAVASVIFRFDQKLMRLAAVELDADRRYTTRLLDFLGNIGTVLALRLSTVSRRLVGERLDAVFVPAREAIKLCEAKWCAVDLLTLGLSWSLVAVYAWQANRGTTTPDGNKTLLLGGVFMVYQYAQQAGNVIGAMAAHMQNFTKVKTDYAGAEPIRAAAERAPSGPVDTRWREISARGLSLVYARTDGVRGGVQDATLAFARGERVALIGPSGGGKSTLLRLLAGLYDPQRGHYLVDGQPAFGVKHLGSVATLIPQESEVFEATVRGNLAFGVAHERAEIERACHVSGFDAVVQTLPNGLDTPISERGFNLSGGQRQRLALARGLLAAGDRSLLLLDEPTSALDQTTEAMVLRRMRQSMPDTTVIASVHRLAALAHFDKVVLVVDGRVVDHGRVDDVIARQPMLREMVAAGGEQRAG